MKFKLLNFLFFLLFVAPIHANEAPSNAPADQGYLVYDGKIYTFATGSSYDYDTTAFSCSTYEEAEAFVDAWYEWLAYYDTLGLPSVYEPGKPDGIRLNLSSWYPNPLSQLVIVPRYSGSEIVSYYVIWSVHEHGTNTAKSSSLFKGAMAGLNTQWHATATPFNAFCVSRGVRFASVPDNRGAHWIYYADAEYIDVPEEPEPTPPEGLADGCITYYQGAWRYTSEYEGPTGDILLQGQAMYAETEEMADRCAADFAWFLASYDWPYYGKPDVLPWSEPLVQKCYVIRNGEVSSVFWRIFFYDLSDPVCPYYSAWNQCLYDYTQYGSGCGGENGIIIYGPFATASASNTGSAQLNGTQLAQSESGMSSVKLTSGGQDVTVTQYTVQKVDAESDTVGTSEVTSEASVSEGADGTINVTNNTTINTNLELGDAPAVQVYTVPREETEKAVVEYDKYAEDPYLVYWLKDESSEASVFFPYKLDIEKIWQDVLDAFYDFIPWDQIRYKVEQFTYSGQLPILSYRIPFMAGSDQFYELAVNYNQLAGNAVIMQIRGILSAIMWIACFGSCLWIWNV